MAHVIGGEDDLRDRASEFAARDSMSKSELRRHWADSVAHTSRVLESFDPSRLMETTERTGKTTTFLQVFLHVSHHNSGRVSK
jgi:hypothetical protein